MAVTGSGASKVTAKEIDLSQTIQQAGTSVAAMVCVSLQGDTTPRLCTSWNSFKGQYGVGDPSVSFDHYSAREYFREGSQLWVIRPAGSGALYAGLLMYSAVQGGVLTTFLKQISAADPAYPDWTSGDPTNTIYGGTYKPLAFFYPSRGQGTYANGRYGVTITANAALPPTLNISTAATGSLAAGTYSYYVTPITANGEGAPVAVSVTVPTNGKITFGIASAPAGVYGYNLYGRNGSTQNGLIGSYSTSVAIIDDGTISPDLTRPARTTLPTNLPFTIGVYDTTVSAVSPVETMVCTMQQAVDESGTSTELESRLNVFSNYLRVTSYAASLTSVPSVTTVGSKPTIMNSGVDGTVTASDIITALNKFQSRQKYAINLLINGGHSVVSIQAAIDSICQLRGDVLGLLDMPSASQTVDAALSYRQLSLNLNSSFSAIFCPDILIQDENYGRTQYIPFSGIAAALCARTDRVQNAGFSIAGLNRGFVSNMLKTRYIYDPETGDQDKLFNAQINYTTTLIGSGTALWEQQTLTTKASALRWISVRRIINVIKVAVMSFLNYSLQEPNDDFTVRQIESTVNQYLQIHVAQRAISAGTCSASVATTPAMIDAGIRVVQVVITPKIPIHQIELQIITTKTAVSFKEVLTSLNGG